MDGKPGRYRVTQMWTGWAVIDSSLDRKKLDDVVETHKTRNAARNRARELNLQDLQERHAQGDAA